MTLSIKISCTKKAMFKEDNLMAFDGIVVANIIKELRETVLGGRISKIAQPESDALMLTIKGSGGQHRLLSLPALPCPLCI